MRRLLQIGLQRMTTSLRTVPATATGGWAHVALITAATTVSAGIAATATGFVDPIKDFDPPSNARGMLSGWCKPVSAFVVPSLVEELFWRAALLPTPTSIPPPTNLTSIAVLVLVTHVASHPLAGLTVWPRGRETFSDPRFLFLALIVLGGATISYVTTGSVWAAALTHGLPVMLWRDFFGGEHRLMGRRRDPSE